MTVMERRQQLQPNASGLTGVQTAPQPLSQRRRRTRPPLARPRWLPPARRPSAYGSRSWAGWCLPCRYGTSAT